MALFEAMPKVLRPNIEVNRKAKIPRGPRITWLNRGIAIYLKYIGCQILKIQAGSQLLQVGCQHLLHLFVSATFLLLSFMYAPSSN